jgi:hypothetical protein
VGQTGSSSLTFEGSDTLSVERTERGLIFRSERVFEVLSGTLAAVYQSTLDTTATATATATA